MTVNELIERLKKKDPDDKVAVLIPKNGVDAYWDPLVLSLEVSGEDLTLDGNLEQGKKVVTL